MWKQLKLERLETRSMMTTASVDVGLTELPDETAEVAPSESSVWHGDVVRGSDGVGTSADHPTGLDALIVINSLDAKEDQATDLRAADPTEERAGGDSFLYTISDNLGQPRSAGRSSTNEDSGGGDDDTPDTILWDIADGGVSWPQASGPFYPYPAVPLGWR